MLRSKVGRFETSSSPSSRPPGARRDDRCFRETLACIYYDYKEYAAADRRTVTAPPRASGRGARGDESVICKPPGAKLCPRKLENQTSSCAAKASRRPFEQRRLPPTPVHRRRVRTRTCSRANAAFPPPPVAVAVFVFDTNARQINNRNTVCTLRRLRETVPNSRVRGDDGRAQCSTTRSLSRHRAGSLRRNARNDHLDAPVRSSPCLGFCVIPRERRFAGSVGRSRRVASLRDARRRRRPEVWHREHALSTASVYATARHRSEMFARRVFDLCHKSPDEFLAVSMIAIIMGRTCNVLDTMDW